MPTPREDEWATGPTAGVAGGEELPRVRASSTSAHRVVGGALSESVVTAEIPVVRVPQSRPGEPTTWNRYGPYTQATAPHEGPLPAPAMLRLAVWILAFILVLMLAGLAVELVHPDWLSFLRNTSSVSPPVGIAPPTVPASTATTTATQTGLVYSLPSSTYTIVITTNAPCWTVIKSPPSSKSPFFIATIAPSTSPRSFAMSGASSVDLSAQITTLSIKSGGAVVAVITKPKLDTAYLFEPTTAHS